MITNFLRALAAGLLCLVSPGISGAEDVPFEVSGGIILVKSSLNGTPDQVFILDTGATENLLTPQAAHKAGMDRAAGRRVSGIVAFGNRPVCQASFIVHDPLQALSLRLDDGINYAGILGYPFISKSVFSIDYQRKRIDWADGATVKAAVQRKKGGILVPFALRDNLIHVSGTVNGSRPLTFLVDTGSAEILLVPRAAEVLRLQTTSGSRADTIRFATLDRIAIGEASVTNVSVVVQRLQREGLGRLTYDGILGYPFLSHFRITFNYRDQVLILKPNPH